jgi:flavocytochrome c
MFSLVVSSPRCNYKERPVLLAITMSNTVIVVGGGLSGLSAAHTCIERGCRVVLLDKNPFMGGNSTKATSGINGATTRTQVNEGVGDSIDAFMKDTALSASKGASDKIYPLGETLVKESAAAVHWLTDAFNLDMTVLGRLGGHSFPRTHRGKEKFPGFTITYAMMERMEDLCKTNPEIAKVVLKAHVTKLLRNAEGHVYGCEYEHKGQSYRELGAVVLATGGYGADYSKDSLLMQYRPDLAAFPTTNGGHSTGDGIKLAMEVGADLRDMECVQVHPTGLVDPKDPTAKTKFLAAEALRGCGGILLDANGKRFCNELGRRDYVSGEMAKGKGPFRLLLNTAASNEIKWHCHHYEKRGIMTFYKSGRDLAQAMGVSASTLDATFKEYSKIAETKNDPYGKKFFANCPVSINDTFYVGEVLPLVHYTMGGLAVSTDSGVIEKSTQQNIPGLWAAGEIMGGTHGLNRLGGSSLLDCVVFGRVSGASVASYLLGKAPSSGSGVDAKGNITINVTPGQDAINIGINWGESSGNASAQQGPVGSGAAATNPQDDLNAEEAKAPAVDTNTEYTLADVAKHNKKDDVWVVVNGQVLDVTNFLPDHPGGAKSLLLFAGKDASEEFNMLHDPNVIAKYTPESVIGKLAPGAAKL